MTKVYEHGLFTICSNLPSGDDGFIPPDPIQWAVKLWKGGPNQAWLSRLLAQGPLSRRAWCLQERHLSPRILHMFLGPTWVWECDTRVRGCNSRGFVYATDIVGNLDWRKINFHNIADSTSSRQALLRLWDILVVDYTQRKVTFENDKLPAISALAQKIQPLVSLDYIAGIWSSDIYSLMWHCDTFFDLSESFWNPDIERLGPETTPFRAPTFSWASVNGSTYSLDKLTPTETAIIERWANRPGDADVIARQHCFPLGEVAFESKALESLPNTVGGSSAVITSQYSKGSPSLTRRYPFIRFATVVSFDKRPLHRVFLSAGDQKMVHEQGDFGFLYKALKECRLYFILLAFRKLAPDWGSEMVGLLILPIKSPGIFTRVGVFKIYHSDISSLELDNLKSDFGSMASFTVI